MFPTPKPSLSPNTYAYESEPMVKATGFREYDARWLFEKEINLMGVQALGMGLGTLIRQMGVRPEIVVAHDFRSYSAAISRPIRSGSSRPTLSLRRALSTATHSDSPTPRSRMAWTFWRQRPNASMIRASHWLPAPAISTSSTRCGGMASR